MNKLLIALFTVAISMSAMAQNGEGGPRGGGQQMREAMKERLKTELKLTDVQVDSVFAIQQEFAGKNREVRTNSALSDDDKKAKSNELNDARKKRLKAALGEESANKLEEFYENMRKMREQRQGQQKQ